MDSIHEVVRQSGLGADRALAASHVREGAGAGGVRTAAAHPGQEHLRPPGLPASRPLRLRQAYRESGWQSGAFQGPRPPSLLQRHWHRGARQSAAAVPGGREG